MERLTVKQIDGTYHIYDNNVIRKANCCDENNKNWFSLYEGNAIDKLGEYEDLEEQGRLIVLPCRDGDTVYKIDSYYICDYEEDYECDCPEYHKCEDEYEEPCEYQYKKYYVVETRFRKEMLAVLGKTIFLTKEEAEKALAEMEKQG